MKSNQEWPCKVPETIYLHDGNRPKELTLSKKNAGNDAIDESRSEWLHPSRNTGQGINMGSNE